MGKQWVDITTIDNNTPFMRVRWKANLKSGDKWFAESPGLVTDGMSWTNGTKDNGWFSAHRMNSSQYCCSFNFDHTQGGFWDVSGTVYRDHVKNTGFSTSGFYDSTVQINGTTYYEIDFSLWSGASGYNLYMPYSNPLNKWNAGDIYVEVGNDTITLDKTRAKFDVTGGSESVVVTANDDWTATVSESWISASTLSGGSGETTITISAPDMSSSPINRTGTVVFTCSGETVTLNVTQKSGAGVSDVYLGANNIEGAFLGDLAVEALYLGENLVYSPGPFAGIKVKPSSFKFTYTGGTTSMTVTSSEDWEIQYDPTYIDVYPYNGNSGETVVTLTANQNLGTAATVTVFTATTLSEAYSKTGTVTIMTEGVIDIPNNQVWYKSTSSSATMYFSSKFMDSNGLYLNVTSDVYDSSDGYRKATFNGNVARIPNNTFKGSAYDFSEIIFPPSLSFIGAYVFNQVSNIESIKFGQSGVITSIGHEAFCECVALKEVRMPTVSGSVGFWTWMGLTAATAITFVQTSGVTQWSQGMSRGGYECFANCPNLEEFLLPGNVCEFWLRDSNKPGYPTTSMTDTAWSELFSGLGTVNNVTMHIGADNVNRLPSSVTDIATNKGWNIQA